MAGSTFRPPAGARCAVRSDPAVSGDRARAGVIALAALIRPTTMPQVAPPPPPPPLSTACGFNSRTLLHRRCSVVVLSQEQQQQQQQQQQ
eukprot:SAG31_NODE_19675_length_594_cov_84.442424_1_plen_89_part_01